MSLLPPPLHALTKYRQFIIYDINTKLPIDYRTGKPSDAHNPEMWLDYMTCSGYVHGHYGLGFVFTENDPFFFLDIDKCLVNGQWSELALELLGSFNGAGVEVSKSGKGLHIIAQGNCPPHSCKNVQLGIELYTEGRYCALTGLNALGDAGTDHTGALGHLVQTYFPDKGGNIENSDWTNEPVEEWNGIEDDDQLIERARASKSAQSVFRKKATFDDLWQADPDVLGDFFPSQSGSPYDASSADAALAQHLAFWTGKNCERMRTIMLKSGLYREKWERSDYLPRTILRATATQKDVYRVEPKSTNVALEPQDVTLMDAPGEMRAGVQYMHIGAQIEHFKGCVYVLNIHRYDRDWETSF